MQMITGLSPLETWGVIVVAFLALCGAWFLLSLALDAFTDWLNLRDYERRYRANDARESAASAEREARQLKAWTHDQEAFKRAGRWDR